MQVEHNFFIGIQDIGENYQISNKAILEILGNMANIHGDLIGRGIKDLDKTHLTWLVLNWKLQVFNRPKISEMITAKTWASNCTKIQADRNYELYNEKGEIFAIATSKWVAVNTESWRIEKLTDEIMEPYKAETDHDTFPNYEFEKINENELQIIHKTKFRIRKSMIDCNNHVHNTAYLDLALEVLPEEKSKISFNNLEIEYKKEIKPDDVIKIIYGVKEGKNYIIIKDEEEKQLHTTIILY